MVIKLCVYMHSKAALPVYKTLAEDWRFLLSHLDIRGSGWNAVSPGVKDKEDSPYNMSSSSSTLILMGKQQHW